MRRQNRCTLGVLAYLALVKLKRGKALVKSLSGTKINMPKVGSSKPKGLSMGGVPDQAPLMDKARSILAGTPSSIRGRRPRLGGL